MPATEITHLISRVTFPAYSKMQEDMRRLREAYLKVLQLAAFLSFPTAGIIFILAPDFTKVFLGEKWMPMVPAMQMLCIYGVIRSVAATMGSVLYAVGKPQIQTKLSSIQLIIMVLIIYPLTIQWGMLGLSLAVTIAATYVIFHLIIEIKKLINVRYRDIFNSLITPTVAVFGMVIAVYLGKSIFSFGVNFISLTIMAITCCTLYLGTLYFLTRKIEGNIYKELHAISKSLKTILEIKN